MPARSGPGLIWAQAAGRVIGRDGGMPWNVPEDLAHFRQVTSGAVVVMGRRTWESLPPRFRPLPGRRNVVVSRRAGVILDGADVAGSLEEALALAGDERVWVIGGGELYRGAIERASELEVTELRLDVDGDTTAPVIDEAVWTATAGPWRTSTSGTDYRFVSYLRRGSPQRTPAR
ncbi:Dihydrofolate reductase [Mycetocola reblochoni REB411]|uniref:Dihydrofolate reductase n=1 Tax=Mycetocola reblochoni REB411 TaxID=1255698 RepID=A0A1R4IG54_9MICO|nr:Dihydrofolate reductase [Mycetocola reblochoni REB411]